MYVYSILHTYLFIYSKIPQELNFGIKLKCVNKQRAIQNEQKKKKKLSCTLSRWKKKVLRNILHIIIFTYLHTHTSLHTTYT